MSSNGHAKRILQPSQFKRTMNCPGWGNFCEANNLKPSPSSKYAMEGSIAHNLGEICLLRGHDAEKYLGWTGWCNAKGGTGIQEKPLVIGELTGKPNLELKIDDDMTDAVQVYVEGIRHKREKSTGATFMVEERLDLSWLIPGMYGTGDHTILEPLGLLSVDDYKHGAGVLVSAGNNVGENVQCSIYGLGAVGEGNPNMVEEAEVTIWQPRSRHTSDVSSSARFDVNELIEWGHDVLVPAAKRATESDAPLVAGEWCQWCDAEKALGSDGKYLCPARREQQLEAADLMFEDEKPLEVVNQDQLTPVPPVELNGEQLDRALVLADMMETWIKSVREESFDRHDKGKDDAPENFKLVQGKMGNRKWADEDVTAKEIKTHLDDDDMYAPAKINSPAQMEKALKKSGKKPKDAKSIVDQLTTRPPGKKILVPATDSRPKVAGSLDDMFAD